MSREREQEKVHALRDRADAKTVHTTKLRMVSIQFEGEAADFTKVVDAAFKVAWDAALTRTKVDKTIIEKGAIAHVKVDP